MRTGRLWASTARILLSNDARADRSDTKLAELRTKRLGRRKKVHLSRTLVLPAVTGARRVLVCADVRRRVHERNEGNNFAASGAVTLSRPADLQPPGTPAPTPRTGRPASDQPPPTDTAPPAPALTATDPASGSESNSPRVKGSAEQNTAIFVYATADCSGPAIGTGTAAELAAAGVQVSLPEDADAELAAKAVRGGTSASSCSNTLHYHDPAALNETDTPGGGRQLRDRPSVQHRGPAGRAVLRRRARLFEAGTTEAAGASAGVVAQYGSVVRRSTRGQAPPGPGRRCSGTPSRATTTSTR